MKKYFVLLLITFSIVFSASGFQNKNSEKNIKANKAIIHRNKSDIDKAKLQKKNIKKQFKEGRISKAEAKARMKNINSNIVKKKQNIKKSRARIHQIKTK